MPVPFCINPSRSVREKAGSVTGLSEAGVAA